MQGVLETGFCFHFSFSFSLCSFFLRRKWIGNYRIDYASFESAASGHRGGVCRGLWAGLSVPAKFGRFTVTLKGKIGHTWWVTWCRILVLERFGTFWGFFLQDLVDFLKLALGLPMENVITALFLLPDVYDAVTLHEALEVYFFLPLPFADCRLRYLFARFNGFFQSICSWFSLFRAIWLMSRHWWRSFARGITRSCSNCATLTQHVSKRKNKFPPRIVVFHFIVL